MAPITDSDIPTANTACAMIKKENHCVIPAFDIRRPLRATVMSLPPELLIMIFEYIDAPLREARARMRASRTYARNIEEFNERITRGNIFPYLHADVCKHWAAVILGVPRFWTNAVVFIGPREKVHGNYMGGGETIFGASGTLPFDVAIRSTRLDLKLDPAGLNTHMNEQGFQREQADVIRVLGLLAPHIHRCRSLSLYTLLVGAMPLVYRHLDGPAPLLRTLMLQTDNIYRKLRRSSSSWYGEILKVPPADSSLISTSFAPPLEKLIIDGYSFRDIHKHHAGICNTYGTNLVSLVLVNYLSDRQNGVHSPLSANSVHALTHFVNLDSLTLSRVNFDNAHGYIDDMDAPPPLEFGVRALSFEYMDGFQLEYFFAVATFPDLEDLRFKACWPEVQGAEIFNHFDLPSNVPLLTLENVMVECVELARGLLFWDVHTIRVYDSPSFDDGVLAMFAAPRERVDEANITPVTEFGCDALRVLSIVVAPEISTAALKRMVASRNRWVDYADPMWRTNTPIGPAILEIRLWQVKDQTVFTEEDEAWFHAHVAHFQFNWVADEWYIKNKLTMSEQDLDRANFSSSDNAVASSTAQLR